MSRQLIEDPQTYATTLLFLFLDQYGTEIFEWEPETFQLQAAHMYGVPLEEPGLSKLQALISAIRTDLFYTSLNTYIHICNALSATTPVDFNVFNPATPYECAWAVTEVALNDGPPENGFSDEIQRYTGLVLSLSGADDAPETLNFADPELVDVSGYQISANFPEVAVAVREKSIETSKDIDGIVTAGMHRLADQLSKLSLKDEQQQLDAFIASVKTR